jgi:DNA-binding Lrp family transcriptional regulator
MDFHLQKYMVLAEPFPLKGRLFFMTWIAYLSYKSRFELEKFYKLLFFYIFLLVFLKNQEKKLYIHLTNKFYLHLIPCGSARLMKQLDNTDYQILHLLQKNAKFTIKEIASEMGMTTTPVYERIKRMEEDGYIQNYVALLDKEKLGLHLTIFCKVSLQDHSQEHLEVFETQVKDHPEIIECFQIAGDFDYLLKVVLQDMAAYQKFMIGKLAKLPNIQKVQSSFVMNQVKCNTQLHF